MVDPTLFPLVCLVGLHGTGKTTIAKCLATEAGFQHLSVGDLARLARKGKVPSNVPTTLMIMLARAAPGSILDRVTVAHLIKHILNLRRIAPVVIDGFPAGPEHIAFLDDKCRIAHIELDEIQRSVRLSSRGAVTVRKWTPGGSSLRDLALKETLHAAASAGLPIRRFSNASDRPSDASKALQQWLDDTPPTPKGAGKVNIHT